MQGHGKTARPRQLSIHFDLFADVSREGEEHLDPIESGPFDQFALPSAGGGRAVKYPA